MDACVFSKVHRITALRDPNFPEKNRKNKKEFERSHFDASPNSVVAKVCALADDRYQSLLEVELHSYAFEI
jgi:hypothetical protein